MIYSDFKIKAPTTSLIGQVLTKKKLPGAKEIRSAVGKQAKQLIKNPVKTIKEGIKRDRAAVEKYKQATGLGRKQATKKIAKTIGRGAYEAGGKDAVVNIGGLAGSKVGAVAGLPGELAGDYFGARAMRKALDTGEARMKAGKIKKNPRFQALDKKTQSDILKKRQKGFRKKIKDDLAGDAVGWGIGNTAALGLQGAGSRVPLQGGLVAMTTVSPTIQGYKIGRRTGSIRKGLEGTRRNIARPFDIGRRLRKARRKERRMIGGIDRRLAGLPSTPEGLTFNNTQPIVMFSKHSAILMTSKKVSRIA